MTNTEESGKSLDIEAIYEKHKPLILRRVLRFYGQDQAEDVVHEIFVKVMEKPNAFHGESSIATWLYRVTTNHCLNRLRNHDRRKELLRENAPTLSFRRQKASQHAAAELEQIWEQLNEEQRQIAVYYYVDGMTQAEIARVIGVSRRTVGNRLEELAIDAAEATT